MTNIDEFFGENESQNVETLIGITKKFFGFVSALADIVDELQNDFLKLSDKIDQLQKTGSAPLSASPPSPTSLSPPPPSPAAPSALPEAPGLPGLPTLPSPATASASPVGPTAPPTTPSGLPPLPGLSPAPQPGYGQPPAPQPGYGQPPAPQPTGPAPRPSPMSLKAQMNMELKEAFARIKKGWDETD